MSNDSAAGRAETSVGGAMLLLFACLPYALLVGMLPDAGDFPGEGGGEARMALGFQQLWAYAAGVATLMLLVLALWVASHAGGIGRRARQALPLVVVVASAAMLFAIDQSFEQAGPWLPLVPILLPPAIGAYALLGCVPALSRWLPGARIDIVGIGLIGAVSVAVVPLWLMDAGSYPERLERHRAELAAADAAARAAGEQREQALRAKFASFGPGSSLRDYIDARQWYLSGVDIVGGARLVRSRQADATAMLDEGMIHELDDLGQLDLRATPALCAAYGKGLEAEFGRSAARRGSTYLSLLERQFANMRWLRSGGCDLDVAVGEIDARLGEMLDGKDPSGADMNDAAAYYSRWGVNREAVEAMRGKLSGTGGAR